MKTSHGTSNLTKSAQFCDARRGIVDVEGIAVSPTVGPYTEARHRAIIALRCATSTRSAHMVTDKYYQKEVQLLRPGTSLPSEHTVSRDMKALHLALAKEGKAYFMVCDLSYI
jgi:hypothetical protein